MVECRRRRPSKHRRTLRTKNGTKMVLVNKDVPKRYDKKEIRRGSVVEREHAPTVAWIKKELKTKNKFPSSEAVYERIAMDHLDEFKDYYDGLEEMESELKKKFRGGKK